MAADLADDAAKDLAADAPADLASPVEAAPPVDLKGDVLLPDGWFSNARCASSQKVPLTSGTATVASVPASTALSHDGQSPPSNSTSTNWLTSTSWTAWRSVSTSRATR